MHEYITHAGNLYNISREDLKRYLKAIRAVETNTGHFAYGLDPVPFGAVFVVTPFDVTSLSSDMAGELLDVLDGE